MSIDRRARAGAAVKACLAAAVLFFQLLRPDGATAAAREPEPVGDASRVVLASNGLRVMGLPFTASASQVASLSEVVVRTADWDATFGYLLFSNWGVRTDAAPVPEWDGSGPIDVEATYSLDDGVTWRRVMFGSGFDRSRISIAPGGTEAGKLEFGSVVNARRVLVRTLRVARAGQSVPGGYRILPSYLYETEREQPGRAVRYSSSEASVAGLLNGGAITSNPSGGATYFYGPIALALDGWDGREVAFVAGDSIAVGSGGHSFVTRGLDRGGSRIPWTNWAQQGTRASQNSSNQAGQWQRRDQGIRLVKALDPQGRTPFTFVLSQMGVNSAGEANFLEQMPAFWAHLRQYGTRLYQTSLTPRSASPNAGFWVDDASQVAVEDNRHEFNARLPEYRSSGLIDGFVDISPVADPRGRHVWPGHEDVTGQSAPFVVTASSTGNTLTVDKAPVLGSIPVVTVANADGSVTTFQGSTIRSVTSVGAGFQFTTSGLPATRSWPVGSQVRFAVTPDGVHVTDLWNERLSVPVTQFKDAGGFASVG